MTERLLQYIWQFQYFNKSNLQTTEGQALQVIQAGTYNTNQGPDFLNANIRIGNTTWAGSVELHLHTSEWREHKHSSDKNYSNVILHVVWKDDIDLKLPFPTLELQNLVSKLLLNKYEQLMNGKTFIACENQLTEIEPLLLISWKERLMIERLQHKAIYIKQLLEFNKSNWEETFWWMLARNFGLTINSDAFENIAKTIPTTILAKHKQQLIQLEALLMGQGGLLDEAFSEDYPILLQKEYRFLQKKYGLKKVHSRLYFLRMRPANFPTIRLAQLASLIGQSQHLFSGIIEAIDFREVEKLFSVTANDYWHYHYNFELPGTYKEKRLGKQMINNILINTVVPMLYSYGYFHNNEKYKTKALLWMESISAEKNNVTQKFNSIGLENKTAFDSQALIQLKYEYCDQKRCLQCVIGNKILKGN